jgi:Flp pilus assembly protein TadG
MKSRRLQSGLTSVEFAIIGTVLMMVVFGVIEMSRALFVANTLTEATRRGARMAAVCPVGDPKPASVAVFDSGSGSSSVVAGLSTANVQVQYLDVNGNPIANPTVPANYALIRYVSVSIVGFTQTMLIPNLVRSIPMNGFTATIPRESLGVPPVGAVTPC